MKRKYKYFSIVLCLMFLTMVSACGKTDKTKNSVNNNAVSNKSEETDNSDTNENTDKNLSEEKDIKLYFSDDQAMYLVQEIRKMNKPTIKTAIEELIKGPTEDKLYKTLPKEAEVINVEIENNIAEVNFTNAFVQNMVGGSAGEIMAVNSIVSTIVLNDFGVEKVQILIEGEKVESLSGHIDVSEPLEPNFEMIKEE